MPEERGVRRDLWYYLGPPLSGAVILFVIVAIRMMGLFLGPHSADDWKQGLLALAVGTAAGFAGGVGYVILGRAVRRVRYLGPYLAGIVTVAPYVGAALVADFLIERTPLIQERAEAWFFAVGTVFFGLVVGHAGFRNLTAAQVASEERRESSLRPMMPLVFGVIGVWMLALRWIRSEILLYAVVILGLVALIGAWIYLRRRPPPAPDPSSPEYWERLIPHSEPLDAAHPAARDRMRES